MQCPPVLKYDYEAIGKDYALNIADMNMSVKDVEMKVDQWLIENAVEDYCLKNVLKMCHYLSVVRRVEILQVRADFYMDQNDKIWFFYASDIVYRPKRQSFKEIGQIKQIKEEIELQR